MMEEKSQKAILQEGVNKAFELAETGSDLLVLRLRALEAVVDTSDVEASLALTEVQDTVSHWRETAMGGVEALKVVFDTYIKATELNLDMTELNELRKRIAQLKSELPHIMISEEVEVLRCIETFKHDALFNELLLLRNASQPLSLRQKTLARLTNFKQNADALEAAQRLKKQIATYKANKEAELAEARTELAQALGKSEKRRRECEELVRSGLTNTLRAITVMNDMFGKASEEFNRIDFRLVTMIAREAAASNVRKMHLHPNSPRSGMSIPMEAQQEELITRFASARREMFAWLSSQKVTTLTVLPA